MKQMGRPRTRNRDLPRGLYKDAAGRFYLKAFNVATKARLGGKTSRALGKDPTKARTEWAAIFGFIDHEVPHHGTLAELIKRFLKEDLEWIIPGKKGKGPRPKYAPATKKEYSRISGHLLQQYGKCKYAKSEADAARGGCFRTMDVSRHIHAAEVAGKGPQGNRDVAVLGSIFRYAKECGLTEYNPCLGAQRHSEEPRDQEMHDAVFFELYDQASDQLRCLMDLNVMVGSRLGDLLRITEFDWSEAGLMAYPSKLKRGQPKRKILFERTEDLAEVIGRAASIKARTLARDRDKPGHEPVQSTYLFVAAPDGKPYTMSGAQSMIRRCKERVAMKRLSAAGVSKPTAEQLLEAVQGIDIHFHDGRARAAADAEDRGENVATFLGHENDSTSRRHYLNRRAAKHQPNAKIRRGK